VLLVDDIQFLSGKDNTQEEFFHTFNQLHMFNKQIVMASDRHPSEMDGVVDRLRSRFQSGLLIDVQVPAFETRVAILRMWASERGIPLPNNVAELLANRARTNIRELESVFNQVAASSQLTRFPVEMESAIAALDGLRRPRNYISLNLVLTITARHYNITLTDLIGTKRSADISQARQIAMYLARELTRASLEQIGDALGGRTHSTVLHSCNKIAADMEENAMVAGLVATIRERLMTDFE
jgi:chromosomal replication initiator protein